jgi:D-alanyl-lipoteichoic acid acyltransferase DltB (MBOAT superfamily)
VQKPRFFNYSQAVEGCRLILWGMFKKVVIADSLAQIVNDIYANPTSFDSSTLILGMVYFSFQIYGDFSGYSDIALGTAKLFGFELLSNFKFPYFARDVAEFWRRWHISLSSWFKDYLYIPLGGSKNGRYKAIRNTFIIFLVSGFWHGASWNFIIWGGIHALAFMPLLLFGKNRKFTTDVVAQEKFFPTIIEVTQMLSTFGLVTIAWLFFRMETWQETINYLETIVLGLSKIQMPMYKTFLIYPVFLIIIDWLNRKNERVIYWGSPKLEKYVIIPILIMAIIYHSTNQSDFIYFAF